MLMEYNDYLYSTAYAQSYELANYESSYGKIIYSDISYSQAYAYDAYAYAAYDAYAYAAYEEEANYSASYAYVTDYENQAYAVKYAKYDYAEKYGQESVTFDDTKTLIFYAALMLTATAGSVMTTVSKKRVAGCVWAMSVSIECIIARKMSHVDFQVE